MMLSLIDMLPEQKQDMQPLYALHESPAASSADGQKLLQLCEEINHQWHDRISLDETTPSNDPEIRHVPFRAVGTIKVRFQKATPMAPRRIDIE